MAGLTGRMALVAALAAGWMTAAQADLVAETPHLQVTGRGEVTAVPDMATVTLGVELEARTAEAVSREAAERMREVLGVLTVVGVAPEDVRTSGLSLRPVYEDRRQDLERAPRLLGFAAQNTLTVTVRDLDGLGDMLDRVISGGANTFRSVRFGLQDPSFAGEDARREAVADALARATVLAEAAGAERGRVLVMSEGGAAAPRYEVAAVRMASDSAVPVAPGTLTVTAEVSMVFELLQ